MGLFAHFADDRTAFYDGAPNARAADTNRGSAPGRGAAENGPAGPGRRRGRREAAPGGRAVGARRRAAPGNLADAASAHGGPALPALATLACAGRGRLRVPAHGGLRRARRAEAEAGPSAGPASGDQQVRVTFARPAGRSGSRPWRRARATASSCPTTTKLIGTSVSESGDRSSTAASARAATASSFVTA